MKELLRKTKVIMTIPILLFGYFLSEVGNSMRETGDEIIEYWESINQN